jgi:multidrug resistance efflux pump
LNVRFSQIDRREENPPTDLIDLPVQSTSLTRKVSARRLQLQPRDNGGPLQPTTQTALTALNQAPKPAELTWRAVALILIFAATAIGTVYAARNYFNGPISPISGSEQTLALASTTFNGLIRPANEIKIAAPAPAVVEKLHVKIGDRVTEGQPLLMLNDRAAGNTLAQAELEKQAAEQQVAQLQQSIAILNQNISSLRSEVTAAQGRVSVAQRRAEQVPLRQRQDSPERAQAVYDQALARYQRAEGLQKRGLISEQEFDEARSQLRIAELDLRSARDAAVAAADLETAQVQQSKLQSDLSTNEQKQQLADLNNQLQNARLRQQQAERLLETARSRVAETTIKATVTGVIVELPVKIGDQIYAGAMLARLAQLDRLIVEVPVSARLINSLHSGQRVKISVPTSDKQQLEGRIITINPLPAANMNHTVEVEFENSTNTLLAGQPAEVRFVTE